MSECPNWGSILDCRHSRPIIDPVAIEELQECIEVADDGTVELDEFVGEEISLQIFREGTGGSR